MKVYLAGCNTPVHEAAETWKFKIKPRPWRALHSYYYARTRAGGVSREIVKCNKVGFDMFLDSGAFTAFTKKVEISVDDYARWIHNHGHMFSVHSNLDAIGGDGAARSYDNFQAMRSLGCNKVRPVFHAREEERWLVKYLDEGHDYIFLGGMVPESTPWLLNWLDRLFERYLTHADGTPRVKVHGFGLTSPKLMLRYPWYSVDSTSWALWAGYGFCAFYDHDVDKFRHIFLSQDSPTTRKINGWHYRTMTPEQQKRIDDWLATFGITADDCASNNYVRNALNCAAFWQLENIKGTTHFAQSQTELF